MDAVEPKKQLFLQRYNFDYSRKVAVSKAITASVQHNLLYAPSASSKDKDSIRIHWGSCLEEVGDEFKKNVSIQKYEFIVEQLKKGMNKKFGDLFHNGSPYGSMFRISHSQKSISVYIKHLWCMGLIGEPNICPIDRIILSSTDAKKMKDISWGCVNSIEEHRRKFKYIVEESSRQNMSVAVWELLKFTN
jgi:hypothetical protein